MLSERVVMLRITKNDTFKIKYSNRCTKAPAAIAYHRLGLTLGLRASFTYLPLRSPDKLTGG